jgi:hypothetical protein
MLLGSLLLFLGRRSGRRRFHLRITVLDFALHFAAVAAAITMGRFAAAIAALLFTTAVMMTTAIATAVAAAAAAREETTKAAAEAAAEATTKTTVAAAAAAAPTTAASAAIATPAAMAAMAAEPSGIGRARNREHHNHQSDPMKTHVLNLHSRTHASNDVRQMADPKSLAQAAQA